MRPLALRIHGVVKPAERGHRKVNLLIIDKVKPDRDLAPADGFQTLYMWFAFVIMGTERPYLPAFVMDDWGNEVRKLSIYDWLYTDGDRYPRTEIFGFEQEWNGEWEHSQRFLREFELSARYPTYVSVERNADLSTAIPIDVIGLVNREDENANTIRIKRPTEWPMPLMRTAAKCWQLPAESISAESLSLD